MSFSIIPLFPVVSLIEFEISFPTELRKFFFAFFSLSSWAELWLLSYVGCLKPSVTHSFAFAVLARKFFLSLIWKSTSPAVPFTAGWLLNHNSIQFLFSYRTSRYVATNINIYYLGYFRRPKAKMSGYDFLLWQPKNLGKALKKRLFSFLEFISSTKLSDK